MKIELELKQAKTVLSIVEDRKNDIAKEIGKHKDDRTLSQLFNVAFDLVCEIDKIFSDEINKEEHKEDSSTQTGEPEKEQSIGVQTEANKDVSEE